MVAINSVAELTTQLNAATGGEILEIAPGALPARTRFVSPSGKTYSSPVTIKSLDTNNKAEFEQFTPGSGNLIFDDIRFNFQHDPTLTGVNADVIPAEPCIDIDNVSDFTIRNCFFTTTGTDPSGEIMGRALDAQISGNIHITGCTFDTINDGVHLNQADNSSFIGNECVRLGSDGIQITSSDNVDITDNLFHNWQNPRASGHIDAIQILRGFGGCSNINILRNVFDMGNGYWGQMNWSGADGRDMSDPFYRHTNVVIEDNIYYAGAINCIAITGVDGLTINQNFIQEAQSSTANFSIPLLTVFTGSTGVTITNNIWRGTNSNFPFEPSYTVSNNHLLTKSDWGPSGQLIAQAVGDTDGYTDLQINSGPAHTGLAGSRMMKRTGGWGGAEITPHASYFGGNQGAVPLPVLPAGSVAATVTVP